MVDSTQSLVPGLYGRTSPWYNLNCTKGLGGIHPVRDPSSTNSVRAWIHWVPSIDHSSRTTQNMNLRILISGGGTPLYHCGTGGCLSTNFSTGPVTRHGRVLTGSNVRCSHWFPQGHATYGRQRSVFASVSTRIRKFRFCVECLWNMAKIY